MSTPQLSAPWQVKFTRRTGSIALQVGTGLIKVLAPKGTPVRAIHSLLEQRRDWIEQALLRQQLQQPQQRPGRSYQQGEHWLFQGQTLQLCIDSDGAGIQPTVERHADQLRLQLPDTLHPIPCSQRRAVLQHWYQQQAEQRWPARLQHWASITGLHPSGLKIRPYKSRWGSCNTRGLISLNTLLLMAPAEVQDYVIIHELCHLQQPNHSRAFWQLVERFCPAPKQHRHWLRQHAPKLLF
ncbi:MAG: SprT family zinc-dependent metalloprotease [Motiliproteus sp.]